MNRDYRVVFLKNVYNTKCNIPSKFSSFHLMFVQSIPLLFHICIDFVAILCRYDYIIILVASSNNQFMLLAFFLFLFSF